MQHPCNPSVPARPVAGIGYPAIHRAGVDPAGGLGTVVLFDGDAVGVETRAARARGPVLAPAKQHGLESRRRSLLQRGQHMRIGIEGQGDGGMAEPLTHHLRVFAGRQEHRGAGVPQVIEPDGRRQACRPEQRLEMPAHHVVLIEGLAGRGGEYQVVGRVPAPGREPSYRSGHSVVSCVQVRQP